MGNCLRPIQQSRGQRVIWQVEVEPATSWHAGVWLDMILPWNNRLEAAYQYTRSRPHMCHMVDLDAESSWAEYEVDLRSYVQTSCYSGTERRVRTVLAPLS